MRADGGARHSRTCSLPVLALAVALCAGASADRSNGASAPAPSPTLPQTPAQVVPIEDSQTYTGLPTNFRALAHAAVRLGPGMSPAGLSKLRITGSTTLVPANLKAIARAVGTARIVDLDLRQESHAIAAGIPVSWYGRFDWANRGRSPAAAGLREQSLIAGLRAKPSAVFILPRTKDKQQGLLLTGVPVTLPSTGAMTERAAVTAAGYGYQRIFATDHVSLTDTQVQQVIDAYTHLAPGAWLAVHCEAGKGRTGLALTLLDMLYNAGQLRIDQIVTREVALGSSATLKVPKDTPRALIAPTRLRIRLMHRFYSYALHNPGGHPQRWLQWASTHP